MILPVNAAAITIDKVTRTVVRVTASHSRNPLSNNERFKFFPVSGYSHRSSEDIRTPIALTG